MTQQRRNRHDNVRLKIEDLPLSAVKENPRDPRTYSPATIRKIAQSVSELGIIPHLVTPEGVSLSGNVWLEAAKLAGLATIPVVKIEHLTSAEMDALMVFNTKAIELGEWDTQKLGLILRGLNLEVHLTGFDTPEIDFYIQSLDQPGPGPDPADRPAMAGPIVSRLGDLWRLGEHRIFCGSALDAESYCKLLSGNLAAMIFTDPPYNVKIPGHVSGLGAVKHENFVMASGEMTEAEFTAMLTRVLKLMMQHSVLGALHYVFMDHGHQFELLTAGRAAGNELLNLCVWTKSNAGMGSLYRSQHELVHVFKNGKAPHRNNVQLGRYGRNRTNVWAYPSISSFGRKGEEGNLLAVHPTVKPVALVADAILDASAPGDIVLDPFLGSGTTVIAAERTRRRGYGIELDPKYVDAAVRRWQAYTGQQATLAETGQAFPEVELARAAHD